MTRQIFITGTDTDAGKTYAAVALLRALKNAGHTAIGLKPVSAGCELQDDQWVNDDAVQLQNNGSELLDYQTVNPVALKAAMAPHIAADIEGVTLDAAGIAKQLDAAQRNHDFTLIEGAGGWLVPLNDNETMADIAKLLNTEVVLVVGMRLGCINHALLTAAAIQSAGLKLSGWIANCIDPDMDVQQENIQTLMQRIQAPLLGVLPHAPVTEDHSAATHLDVSKL